MPDLVDAALRVAGLDGRAWPLATKLDIVRMKPRAGFTNEQAQLSQVTLGNSTASRS